MTPEEIAEKNKQLALGVNISGRSLVYLPIEFQKNTDPAGGKVFMKELIREGTWTRPGSPDETFTVNRARMQGWVDNFTNGLLPEGVMITLGHDTWDPMKAVGLVDQLSIEVGADGVCRLMGRMNIMLDDVASRINGTIRGVSLGIDMNYIDPKTGSCYGETIYHVALTNDPHIKGMDPFVEIDMGREGKKEKILALVFQNGTRYKLSGTGRKEGVGMTPEEKIIELERKQKESDVKLADVSAKHAEAVAKNLELARQTEDLAKKQHETDLNFQRAELKAKVEALIAEGKVLPAERETVLELVLSGVDLHVEVDGKKISVAEKTLLTFSKMQPKVSLGAGGRKGKTATQDGGNGEGPKVEDLTIWKYQMFFGQISVDEFKKRRDQWATDFQTKLAYQASDREVLIGDRGDRGTKMLARIGMADSLLF